MRNLALMILVLLSFFDSFAEPLQTNSVRMPNPPPWIDSIRVDKVTDGIEATLDWPIKRVTAYWHSDPQEFQAGHGYGPSVLAYSLGKENAVHLGPKVTSENFDKIFGHELVHVILYQKYKKAIPAWLEEGLASYIAGEKRVDYAWLAKQKRPEIRTMSHPYKGNVDSHLHYILSTAVMEMIASKCPLNDLLQLSVGKSLETYLVTFCEISDLNQEFDRFLKEKSKRR